MGTRYSNNTPNTHPHQTHDKRCNACTYQGKTPVFNLRLISIVYSPVRPFQSIRVIANTRVTNSSPWLHELRLHIFLVRAARAVRQMLQQSFIAEFE